MWHVQFSTLIHPHSLNPSKSFEQKQIQGPQQLLKGPLSGLRQLLVPESSLKVMKFAFYFTLKAFHIKSSFCS